MNRRPYGRDFALTMRMAIALVPIVMWYLAVAALLVVTVVATWAEREWDAFLGALLFTAGGPVALWGHVRKSEAVALRAARAKVVDEGDEPILHDVVHRVAAQADIRPPRVAVIDSARVSNAFSVGVNDDRAVIAVTTGLLRQRLTTAELESVVAHELAHIANRDGAVMTLVGVPSLLGSAMWNDDDWRTKAFFVLLYWPVFFSGLLLMWTISRYREYVADRAAAMITGAPEQLMSALQKLAGRTARGDLRGGLAVQALCIVPAHRRRGWRRFELFSDHPPLEKRLARLAELSRELGKPA